MQIHQTTGQDGGWSRRAAILAGIGSIGALAGGTALLRTSTPGAARSSSEPGPQSPNSHTPANVSGDAPSQLLTPGNEKIAILLYPGFTALDVVGPHHVFINMVGAQVRLVAQTMEPVPSDTGFSMTPNATLDQVVAPQTLLLVPGGTTGTLDAIENPKIMAFLKTHGATAQWVGSVCTGSVLLAAAGLLHGYRATSHWLTRDVLRAGGAIPVAERYVEDRNRVTGAGVSAGIDFGLHLVKKWRGTTYAKGVQMFMEYDPRPPFDSGSPGSPAAEPAMVEMLRAMHEPFAQQATQLVKSTFAP